MKTEREPLTLEAARERWQAWSVEERSAAVYTDVLGLRLAGTRLSTEAWDHRTPAAMMEVLEAMEGRGYGYQIMGNLGHAHRFRVVMRDLRGQPKGGLPAWGWCPAEHDDLPAAVAEAAWLAVVTS